MNQVFNALFIVFGIMFTGLACDRIRLFPSGMQLCLNRFVYWIGLPALIFTQTCSAHATEGTASFLAGFLPAAVICHAAAFILFRALLKDSPEESAARALESVMPNAAFFGIPFICMIFPGNETAVLGATLASILYTAPLLLGDVSLTILRRTDGSKSLNPAKILLQVLRNPNLAACIAGALFPCTGLAVPHAISGMTGMLGATAAPCALFSMGMMLNAGLTETGSFRGLRPSRLATAGTAKLVLQPAATFLLLKLAGCSGMLLAAGTISAAMPTAAIVFVVCELHGQCAAESSALIILTTLLSFLTLPAAVFLLHISGAC